MNRLNTAAIALSLLLAGCAPAAMERAAAPAPIDYSAALADPARPAADRERDAARKPAELLAFAEIAPGEKVGDFVMGGGYVTRLLAAAVGPTGKVYGFQPAEFIAFKAQYGEDQKAVDAAYAMSMRRAGRSRRQHSRSRSTRSSRCRISMTCI